MVIAIRWFLIMWRTNKSDILYPLACISPKGCYNRKRKVHYPSNIDLSPVEIPREKKLHLLENGASVEKISSNLEHEKPSVEESTILPTKNNNQAHVTRERALRNWVFDETAGNIHREFGSGYPGDP
ncbi:unnamed protein product [Lactuca saligna]|uniref:Uncharacterized protein n=1 Tax=Lactuca saligna TaxID=75948 RepID=A0AA35VR21_LACSI|nr:unnamed protein product [Lactuca saligna]